MMSQAIIYTAVASLILQSWKVVHMLCSINLISCGLASSQLNWVAHLWLAQEPRKKTSGSHGRLTLVHLSVLEKMCFEMKLK